MNNDIEKRIAKLERQVDDIIEYLGVLMLSDLSNSRRLMWVNYPKETYKLFGHYEPEEE